MEDKKAIEITLEDFTVPERTKTYGYHVVENDHKEGFWNKVGRVLINGRNDNLEESAFYGHRKLDMIIAQNNELLKMLKRLNENMEKLNGTSEEQPLNLETSIHE